jgi:SAM-dependent methyltransferase
MFRDQMRQRLRTVTAQSRRSLQDLSPEEQSRIARLQGLLNGRSMRAMRLEPGQRVLEAGAFMGHLACLMAREVGEHGQVVGIEEGLWMYESGRRRAMAECPSDARPDLRRGSPGNPPLEQEEWGTFDVAHARFVLRHSVQPELVVEHLVNAVRPGGRILLEDDDHGAVRLWPEPSAVMKLWRAYMEVSDVLDTYPRVGRDLVRLAVRAGARPQRAECLSLTGCAGDARFPVLRDNFVGLLRGAREAIVECGLLSSTEVDSGILSLEEWGRRGDAVLWYSTCWVEATRPVD